MTQRGAVLKSGEGGGEVLEVSQRSVCTPAANVSVATQFILDKRNICRNFDQEKFCRICCLLS